MQDEKEKEKVEEKPKDKPEGGEPPKEKKKREGTIEERVADIVAEQMGVSKDQIKPETSFVNDLGADSLDTVELVMNFEDEFDLNIPDSDAEKIQTVGDAIEYIKKRT